MTTMISLMERVRARDCEAVTRFYLHLKGYLYRLACRRLAGVPSRLVEPESVVDLVMLELIRKIERDDSQLRTDTSLRRISSSMVANQVAARVRFHRRKRRDYRRNIQSLDGSVESVRSQTPPPSEFARDMELRGRLLDELPDDTCRKIALLLVDNYSQEEIVKRVGKSRATVARKIQRIRTTPEIQRIRRPSDTSPELKP